MRRRELLTAVSPLLAGSVAGCLGNRFLADGTDSATERVDFTRIESEYAISITNELDGEIEVTVSVTGSTGTTANASVSVEAGKEKLLRQLFSDGREPYDVSVSGGGESREITVRPSESREDEFAFTIVRDGIGFRKLNGPTADIVLSNRLPDSTDVGITIESHRVDRREVSELSIPADEVESYGGVFEEGTTYDVRVRTESIIKSTTHLNSSTNSLWIVVDRDGLRIDVSEV